jgi:hypothetical protein
MSFGIRHHHGRGPMSPMTPRDYVIPFVLVVIGVGVLLYFALTP